jgi:hypothetical protein
VGPRARAGGRVSRSALDVGHRGPARRGFSLRARRVSHRGRQRRLDLADRRTGLDDRRRRRGKVSSAAPCASGCATRSAARCASAASSSSRPSRRTG